jgi:hypothetical protein
MVEGSGTTSVATAVTWSCADRLTTSILMAFNKFGNPGLIPKLLNGVMLDVISWE